MEVEDKKLSHNYKKNMGKNNNYHCSTKSVIEKLHGRVPQKNIINYKMLKWFF
jgi:hypothetical protein